MSKMKGVSAAGMGAEKSEQEEGKEKRKGESKLTPSLLESSSIFTETKKESGPNHNFIKDQTRNRILSWTRAQSWKLAEKEKEKEKEVPALLVVRNRESSPLPTAFPFLFSFSFSIYVYLTPAFIIRITASTAGSGPGYGYGLE